MPLILNAHTRYDKDGKIYDSKYINTKLNKKCELQGCKERMMTDEEWYKYVGENQQGIPLKVLQERRKDYFVEYGEKSVVDDWETRDYVYNEEVELFLGFRRADIIEYKVENNITYLSIARQIGWTHSLLTRFMGGLNAKYNKYMLLSLKRWWEDVHQQI